MGTYRFYEMVNEPTSCERRRDDAQCPKPFAALAEMPTFVIATATVG